MTPLQSTTDPASTRRKTILVVAALAAMLALALGSGALGDFFAGFNDGLHAPQSSANAPAK